MYVLLFSIRRKKTGTFLLLAQRVYSYWPIREAYCTLIYREYWTVDMQLEYWTSTHIMLLERHNVLVLLLADEKGRLNSYWLHRKTTCTTFGG